MIFIDPQTRQRVVYAKHCGDVSYNRVGDSAIAKESIPVIGNWSDYTGSGIVNTQSQMYGAGTSNELQGQDAGLVGEKLGQLNEIGQNKQIFRRRQSKVLFIPK